MSDLLILDTVLMVASVITAATVIFIFFGKGFKTFRKFVHFLDDFHGEEERPGTPRRPGISERLTGVESNMCDLKDSIQVLDSKVTFVEKELHPNHGSSMRDAVDRIQMRLDILEERMGNNVNN